MILVVFMLVIFVMIAEIDFLMLLMLIFLDESGLFGTSAANGNGRRRRGR